MLQDEALVTQNIKLRS